MTTMLLSSRSSSSAVSAVFRHSLHGGGGGGCGAGVGGGCHRQYYQFFRFFSAGTEGGSEVQYFHGRVKMYVRQKNYGFIVADHNGQDYFCHRSSIQGAPVQNESPPRADEANSSNNNNNNTTVWMLPYLVKGERVRFALGTPSPSSSDNDNDEDDDGDTTPQALDVTYEDGSQIPVYRLGYVKNVQRWEMNVLGQRVFEIMNQHHNHDAGDADAATISTMEKIAAAYQDARSSIADAQARFDAGNEGAVAAAAKSTTASHDASDSATTPADGEPQDHDEHYPDATALK